MLAVVLLSACTATKHAQAPETQFIATIEPPEVVVYLIPRSEPPTPPIELPGLIDPTPTPTPPKLAPTQPPNVSAASVPGIPAVVPLEFHERYLECTSSSERFSVPDYVWRLSRDAGNAEGWDYTEAMYVIGHEGGNDFCQFNSQGSGACGPFQLLTCPPDGLTPEGQMRGAMAKFQDGLRRYPSNPWQAHWFAFWTN